MKEYYTSPLINASTLKKFTGELDPQIAKHQLLHPAPPSDAMALGSLVHSLIEHEGELNDDEFAVSPYPNFRTKEARQWKQDMLETGKRLVDAATINKAQTMRNAILKQAPSWMFKGDYEDEKAYYGDKFKCLVDRAHFTQNAAIDWKTSSAVSSGQFIRDAIKYGYFLQAAFYLHVTGLKEFWFVAVSTVEPYPVWTFKVGPQALAYGKQQWEKALANLESSVGFQAGKWEELDAPSWFKDSPEEVFEI
jgi:hypothetical protein